MKKLLQLRALEIIAFTSGFALMAFELVAARILAPYIGSSMYVWTSVIGVIIASLSLGYYMGGRLADTHRRIAEIAWLCLASALAVVIMAVLYQPALEWIVRSIADDRVQGMVASLILFAPTSFFIGIKAPYLAKLKVESLERTGRSIASLSALNAVGGIIGVFVSGFILFSYIGSRETLAVITTLLVASSWLIVPRQQLTLRLALSAVLLLIVLIPAAKSKVTEIDTPTAHYQVIEGYVDGDRRQIRALVTGPSGAQSGVYTDGSNDLAFWYTREMARVVAAQPDKARILMLGGGTFTLPSYLAERYPLSTVDVVEIDPKLKDVAAGYFNFQPRQNLNVIDEDARSYVNTAKESYDVILVDVYSDMSVPFSLMTKEYGENVAKLLKRDGVLAANVIAATAGPCRPLFDAVDATYRNALPHGTYMVRPGSADIQRTNMIVTYSRKGYLLNGFTSFEAQPKRPYSDNFMPAERLQQACKDNVV